MQTVKMLIVIILTSSVVLPVCYGQDDGRLPYAYGNPLPTRSEVKKVDVELYDSPFYRHDVTRFKLPDDQIQEFLSRFRYASKDKAPDFAAREIGTARVFLADGKLIRITWYWTGGKTPLQFSLRGDRNIAPASVPQAEDALSLDGFLRGIANDVLRIDFSELRGPPDSETSPQTSDR